MGGYLHPDPAVEKWIRMRDSHAQFFRWNSRNLRSVGALGLAIPAGLMYLAVVYNNEFKWAAQGPPAKPKNAEEDA